MSTPRKIPILLLDGGTGTALSTSQFGSHTFDSSTPLWSSHLLLTSPESLTALHTAYVAAGVDVLLSATYQASFEGFARTSRVDGKVNRDAGNGYGKEEAERFMLLAVQLAADTAAISGKEVIENREIAMKGRSVALSLGAYGATLIPSAEYSGIYPEDMRSREALAEWHWERLKVFTRDARTWKSIEYVAFETIRGVEEIWAARRVMQKLKEESPELKKWWISCVVPKEVQDEQDVVNIIRAMLGNEEEAPRPWGVGVNCSSVDKVGWVLGIFESEIQKMIEPSDLRKIGEEWKQETEFPWLVVYPDGADGLVYNTTTMAWEASGEVKGDQEWDEKLWMLVKHARYRGCWEGILVGGCCKTGPEEIRKLRQRIDTDLDPYITLPYNALTTMAEREVQISGGKD